MVCHRVHIFALRSSLVDVLLEPAERTRGQGGGSLALRSPGPLNDDTAWRVHALTVLHMTSRPPRQKRGERTKRKNRRNPHVPRGENASLMLNDMVRSHSSVGHRSFTALTPLRYRDLERSRAATRRSDLSVRTQRAPFSHLRVARGFVYFRAVTGLA